MKKFINDSLGTFVLGGSAILIIYLFCKIIEGSISMIFSLIVVSCFVYGIGRLIKDVKSGDIFKDEEI